MATADTHAPMAPLWLNPEDCRVDDLEALIIEGRQSARPARAAEQLQGVPIYDCGALRHACVDPAYRRALMQEWHTVLASGAGVMVLSGAWSDAVLLEAVSAQFHAMIDTEAGSRSGGDHFAKAGANNRVWNALQKLALRAPALFCRYYANDMLAWVSQAWLGPAYQVTSQVNCVNPGGAAQSPHRDYHLGFCTPGQAAAYPASVHRMSPHLTLQGAVAHVDMPIESGPTLLLPHSQKYLSGYLVPHRPDFAEFFAAQRVQLPLRRGDAVFFNPALMHAAGDNVSTGIRRLGNLLQVSSAFGRAMESIDRVAMSLAIYPALGDAFASGELDREAAGRVIAACAEGYAFPTNLDVDPPLAGLAPASHQALMGQALDAGWDVAEFKHALEGAALRQRP